MWNNQQYNTWDHHSQPSAYVWQQAQSSQPGGGWGQGQGWDQQQQSQYNQNGYGGGDGWTAVGPSQRNSQQQQQPWVNTNYNYNNNPQQYNNDWHYINQSLNGAWGAGGGAAPQFGAFQPTQATQQSWRRGNDAPPHQAHDWSNQDRTRFGQNGSSGDAGERAQRAGPGRAPFAQSRRDAAANARGPQQQPQATYDQHSQQQEEYYQQAPLPSDASWRSQTRFSTNAFHPPPRFPSPPPNSQQPQNPGKRRAKIKRAGPQPKPSKDYHAIVNSERVVAVPETAPLLVLDLNNTLLCRRARSSGASLTPLVRPYLATFLSYICGKDENGKRRWNVAVYSSARSYNVLSMLQALELVPADANERVEARARKIAAAAKTESIDIDSDGGVTELPKTKVDPKEAGRWHAEAGDPLALVWSREWMGLTADEFQANVETTKDLALLWKELGTDEAEGVRRSVLLDDEAFKASQQPHNHLPIEGFFIDQEIFPPDPKMQPNMQGARRTAAGAINVPVQLAEGLPEAEDSALLSTIYFLSRLAKEENMAKFIKNGGLDTLRAEVGGEAGAVECGRAEAERVGVRVAKEWTAEWAAEAEGAKSWVKSV